MLRVAEHARFSLSEGLRVRPRRHGLASLDIDAFNSNERTVKILFIKYALNIKSPHDGSVHA
jgi:hypothetical protein